MGQFANWCIEMNTIDITGCQSGLLHTITSATRTRYIRSVLWPIARSPWWLIDPPDKYQPFPRLLLICAMSTIWSCTCEGAYSLQQLWLQNLKCFEYLMQRPRAAALFSDYICNSTAMQYTSPPRYYLLLSAKRREWWLWRNCENGCRNLNSQQFPAAGAGCVILAARSIKWSTPPGFYLEASRVDINPMTE
jgi:hypothetical protein